MSAIAIRENTLKMMLHAIGYHPDDVRRGKYLFYRNYYGTSPGQDRFEWESLADKGYAYRDGDSGIFILTGKGLDFLENVLGIKLHNKYITEYEVLDVFIDNTLDAGSLESGINVVYVADALRISRYRAKKLIDSLRNMELIELCCVATSLNGDAVCPPRWVYVLTEKAKYTEEYKKRTAEKERHDDYC